MAPRQRPRTIPGSVAQGGDELIALCQSSVVAPKGGAAVLFAVRAEINILHLGIVPLWSMERVTVAAR